MIRREQIRLRKLFQRLAVASLAAPAAVAGVVACSSRAPDDDARDASTDTTGLGQEGGAASQGDGGLEGAVTCSQSPSAPYLTDASYAQLADADPGSPFFTCYYFVDVPCTTNAVTKGCNLTLAECAKYCTEDGGYVDCLYWEGHGCEDGSVTVQPGEPAMVACGMCSGVGRRPAGLLASRGRARGRGLGPLAAYFAEMAHLEAASVVAFERLRGELALHDAPAALVDAADRAAADEVRHARVAGRIARRWGSQPEAPRVRRRAPRSLEQIARENAVEGCVRETFGAMVATWQASHARDPEVRRAMRRIAVDETRHAALAWAIARWADGRLDAAARARIQRARRAAVRALARDVGRDLPAAIGDAAGVPSGDAARALVGAMSDLWA